MQINQCEQIGYFQDKYWFCIGLAPDLKSGFEMKKEPRA
jgi:hypothetical protein